ncbi:MAG: diguanylate cyclase [Idiomarina sp.]|nr:diguanylate cyclase [Idiomarina sp.]
MSEQDLVSLISACENEPIHIPGGIQPYGALLAYTPYFAQLKQASVNAGELLNCDDIWSASMHSLIDGHVLQTMREALQFGETFSAEANGYTYVAYASGPYWVIEIEKPGPNQGVLSVRSFLHSAYKALREQRNPQALLEELTRQVRQISGFERVMVYQFDNDWHGRVTAEATGSRLDSMLGHHFPASDIPPQARAMYSKNPFRIIGSARREPIAMQAQNEQDMTPLDMSAGTLRAVSPVHMQYLQNLGVAASSSIGIFEEQALWGIIACHHVDDIWLAPKKREALSLIVEFAAQRYFYLQTKATQNYQRRVHEVRDAMAQEDIQQITTQSLISSHGHGWLRLLDAVGCIFVRQSSISSVGEVLQGDDLRRVLDWLDDNVRARPFWSTRCLAESTGLTLASDEKPLSGLLAVPMSAEGDRHAWLLFFRTELVEIKRWAGKPEKHVYQGATGDMLGPRKSFAMWQQKVEGRSSEWTNEALYAARDIARDLLIVADSMHLQSLNEKLEDVNKKLKYLAERDDLTGVWSRRVAEQRMQDAQQNAMRYHRPYSVLLLDLDKFKHINDEYGHSIGDQVLLSVCATVNQQIRETDLFARWGGEEFLLLATETAAAEAIELAERIRAAIEKISEPELPQVTVSIGVAEFNGSKTWDSVVDRADKAMYTAKQKGRNQVVA